MRRIGDMAIPRPTQYSVKRSRPHQGCQWRVTGYKDGIRKIHWFKNEREARAFCQQKNLEIEAFGSHVAISTELRLEAYQAQELLRPHGKTLLDAARFLITHIKETEASLPFNRLAEAVRKECTRRLVGNEISSRHAESLENALRKLEVRFAERIVSTITSKEIKEWLLSLPLATLTKNKIKGYVSQIFNFAVREGFSPSNPMAGMKKLRSRATAEDGIQVYTVEEVIRLLNAAEAEVIPFLVLSFFCGIRRATLERLNWKDVRFDERKVVVPRFAGKNQQRYSVTLEDNAMEWLAPHAERGGSFVPSKRKMRRLVMEAARTAGVTLRDNGMRHSFISYHVEHFQSIDKTSLQADNSPAVIKEHYLHLVTKEEAAKYWEIYPSPSPS